MIGIYGYLFCALSALASALATLFIKYANHAGDGLATARLAWLGAACIVYGLGFVSYSVALQKLHMSLAYPIMTGMAMAMVAIIGFVVLDEPMSVSKVAGMVLIALGAFALSR